MARRTRKTEEAPAAEPQTDAQGRPMSMSASIDATAQARAAAEAGQLRSKATAAAFGEVIGALMRSPRHRQMRLDDLERLIVPCIALSQFAVANAQVPNRPGETAPVGVIFWALVSPEVDARLAQSKSAPLVLGRNDFRSGDIPWIVDGAGQPEMLQRLVAEVSQRGFGGRAPKVPPGLLGG